MPRFDYTKIFISYHAKVKYSENMIHKSKGITQ